MTKDDVSSFAPFAAFRAATRAIAQNGNMLSMCAGIAQTLLLDPSQPKRQPSRTNYQEIGHSPADIGVRTVALLYGWVTLDDFAKREGCSLADVKYDAERGLLGRMHHRASDNAAMVFWPTTLQGTDKERELPLGIGHYEVNVAVEVTGHQTLETDLSSSPEELADKRAEMLFVLEKEVRSWEDFDDVVKTFQSNELVALWTSFDEFVSNLGRYIVRRVSHSPQYAYIRNLYWESDKHGTHRMLDFLEEAINWRVSPFDGYFTFGGRKEVASKEKVLEIKELRNQRMHPRPRIHWRLRSSPRLQIISGAIVPMHDYNSWSKLALTTVAHRLSRMFVRSEFEIR
jgi:hypothetical protein